jgi:hypothetical protein
MSVEPKQPPQCFFSGHGASRQKGNQTSSHVRISDQPKLATSDPPPRRRQVGQSSRAKIFPSGLQKYSTQRFLPLGMGKSCFLTDSPRHEQESGNIYLDPRVAFPVHHVGVRIECLYPVFILHVTLSRSPMSAPAFGFLVRAVPLAILPAVARMWPHRHRRHDTAGEGVRPGSQSATKRVHARGPPHQVRHVRCVNRV